MRFNQDIFVYYGFFSFLLVLLSQILQWCFCCCSLRGQSIAAGTFSYGWVAQIEIGNGRHIGNPINLYVTFLVHWIRSSFLIYSTYFQMFRYVSISFFLLGPRFTILLYRRLKQVKQKLLSCIVGHNNMFSSIWSWLCGEPGPRNIDTRPTILLSFLPEWPDPRDCTRFVLYVRRARVRPSFWNRILKEWGYCPQP